MHSDAILVLFYVLDELDEDSVVRKWVIIRDTDQGLRFFDFLGDDITDCESLHDIRGVRSVVVGSSLYFIGGVDRGGCVFSDNVMLHIDTCLPDASWQRFELPFYSSHMKVVVYRDFIYMFPELLPFYYKGVDDIVSSPRVFEHPRKPSIAYMFNTATRKGEDIGLPGWPTGFYVAPRRYHPDNEVSSHWKDEFWPCFFPGFRVCAAWGERGLLICVLGDNFFYLHDPSVSHWDPLPDLEALPDFLGRLPSQDSLPLPSVKTFSGIVLDCLYCLDVPDQADSAPRLQVDSVPRLHSYDLRKGKLDFSHDFSFLPPEYTQWEMLPQVDGELSFLGYLEDYDRHSFGHGEFKYLRFRILKERVEVVKTISFQLPFSIHERCNSMLIDIAQLQIEPRDFSLLSGKVASIQASVLVELPVMNHHFSTSDISPLELESIASYQNIHPKVQASILRRTVQTKSSRLDEAARPFTSSSLFPSGIQLFGGIQVFGADPLKEQPVRNLHFSTSDISRLEWELKDADPTIQHPKESYGRSSELMAHAFDATPFTSSQQGSPSIVPAHIIEESSLDLCCPRVSAKEGYVFDEFDYDITPDSEAKESWDFSPLLRKDSLLLDGKSGEISVPYHEEKSSLDLCCPWVLAKEGYYLFDEPDEFDYDITPDSEELLVMDRQFSTSDISPPESKLIISCKTTQHLKGQASTRRTVQKKSSPLNVAARPFIPSFFSPPGLPVFGADALKELPVRNHHFSTSDISPLELELTDPKKSPPLNVAARPFIPSFCCPPSGYVFGSSQGSFGIEQQ